MPILNLAHPTEQQSRWSLFLGILIWFLHLNALNALTSVACKWGLFMSPIAGITALQFIEVGITLIVMSVMFFVIFLPWRFWRGFQTEKPTTNRDLLTDTENYGRPLIAFIAMLLNSLLLLFVIATFVPIFALNACGQA